MPCRCKDDLKKSCLPVQLKEWYVLWTPSKYFYLLIWDIVQEQHIISIKLLDFYHI